MSLIAYHNNQSEKDEILAQLAAHRKADELIKGQYWEDGKGCAVGCTIHSGNHIEYEERFGIPVMLARLEDCIFEGLPNDKAKNWPERFMSAIEPGQDLSLVGWKFLHWLLTDEMVNPGINHEAVRDTVQQCADIMKSLAGGDVGTESAESAWRAAERAADSAAECAAERAAWRAADSAAECAAECAEWSARSAAKSAKSAKSASESAAWSASESAAWSASESARSASESARSAAESAAWSASESAAWSASESAAYQKMADRLIYLIERSPHTRIGLERRER